MLRKDWLDCTAAASFGLTQKDARNDISPHPMFSTLAMKPRYSPNSTEMPMMPMMT